MQNLPYENITLAAVLLSAVVYLVKGGLPQIIAYLDKKNEAKEAEIKELNRIHDEKIAAKDAAITEMIREHEARNDRKDKALEVLTNQVLRESEQNRIIAEKAINAISEIRSEVIPLRELNANLSNHIIKVNELIEIVNARD